MSALSVLNILRSIKERTSVSRTDLQHATGLSWGTITNTTRDLLNRNLIKEEGASNTKNGRKPGRLAINPSTHSLVGVDIGRKSVQVIILNLAGETLWNEETPFTNEEAAESVLERAAKLIQKGLNQPDICERICLGIGVSVPGAVDVRNGVLKFAPHM